jgi:rhodanese-related sulfurtransferase
LALAAAAKSGYSRWELTVISGAGAELSMPQKITTGYKALMAEAEAAIENLEPAEVLAASGNSDVVLVDLRDPRELEREGEMPGAFHCPRGMLEFWIDPESPYAKPVFQQDKKFIFFCAGGWRSVLAAKTAQDMGLQPVASMRGGFSAWKQAGLPVKSKETAE